MGAEPAPAETQQQAPAASAPKRDGQSRDSILASIPTPKRRFRLISPVKRSRGGQRTGRSAAGAVVPGTSFAPPSFPATSFPASFPAPSFPSPSFPGETPPSANFPVPSMPAPTLEPAAVDQDGLPFASAATERGGGRRRGYAEILHIRCPSGHLVKAKSDLLGKSGRCPACKKTFELRYENSVEFQRRREKILQARGGQERAGLDGLGYFGGIRGLRRASRDDRDAEPVASTCISGLCLSVQELQLLTVFAPTKNWERRSPSTRTQENKP